MLLPSLINGTNDMILGIFSTLMNNLYGGKVETENTNATNAANLAAVSQTNATNYQIAKETNASNVRQAELAYQRSLPSMQIRNMMNAGMSRAGALASLTGGGTYAAPVMQGSTAQSPRFEKNQFRPNFDKLADLMRGFQNIPANVQQMRMNSQQLENLRQEYALRSAEEQRKQEEHNMMMEEKLFNKNERKSIQNLTSLITARSQERNIQPKENQSFHDYIRELGLEKDDTYLKASEAARQKAFENYKSHQEEGRAQIESADKHDAVKIHNMLMKVQLTETQRSLVYRLILLAQQVVLGSLQIESLNDEKQLRRAGFDSKKEAAQALATAENLRAKYEKDKARRLANAPDLLPIIDLTLEKLNPLRELIKVGK